MRGKAGSYTIFLFGLSVLLMGCSGSKSTPSQAPQAAIQGYSQGGAPAWLNNAPASYTVKSSDSVWDVSRQFLKHPWDWERVDIQHVRKGQDRYGSLYNGQANVPVSRSPMPSVGSAPVHLFPGDIVRQVQTPVGRALSVERGQSRWSP